MEITLWLSFANISSKKASEEAESEGLLDLLLYMRASQILGGAVSEWVEVIGVVSRLKSKGAFKHVVLALNGHILESHCSCVKVQVLHAHFFSQLVNLGKLEVVECAAGKVNTLDTLVHSHAFARVVDILHDLLQIDIQLGWKLALVAVL